MNEQPQRQAQQGIALPPDVAQQRQAQAQAQNQVQNILINLSGNILCQLVGADKDLLKDTWHVRRREETIDSHRMRVKERATTTAYLAAQYAGSLLEVLGLIQQKPQDQSTPD